MAHGKLVFGVAAIFALGMTLEAKPRLAAAADTPARTAFAEHDARAATTPAESRPLSVAGALSKSDDHSVSLSEPAAETEDAEDASTGEAAGGARRLPEGAPGKIVFLSGEAFDGKEVGDGSPDGGTAGGDAHCQRLAEAAGLGGRFSAWLSDGSSSPSLRFTRSTQPYALVDGVVVADDWSDLTDGTLDHRINLDETGRPPDGRIYVWTGTGVDGAPTPFHCNGWKNHPCRDCLGTLGLGEISHEPYKRWTAFTTAPCVFPNRLYCFQQ